MTRSNVEPEQPQIDHLVVIRESDEYGMLLMEGMIQQTLAKVRGLPGSDELRVAGTDVMKNPSAYKGVEHRSGSSRQVAVERDGVLYLYSMGTAAKSDQDRGTNAFVASLVETIERYKPKEVWTSSFSRLIRAAEHAGRLLQVVSEHVAILHADTDITPATPEGKLIFQVLTMIAAAERDQMVRRHTAGRVAQWRRGAWIPNTHPPGYRLDKDRRLILDPSQVEQTRQMLRLLGDLSLTPRQVADRLGEIGITRPRIQKMYGPDATFADLRNPSQAITSLLTWLDVYRAGTYEVVWTNPFPGVTEIAGVHVEAREPTRKYPHGALPLIYQLEVPEGGWADADTIANIAQRRTKHSAGGGTSHRNTPPLSGLFQYRDGDNEYCLVSKNDRYLLLRRPYDPQRSHLGWQSERQTEPTTIARISRADLHQSIATEVVTAIKEGLPAHLDTSRSLDLASLVPISSRHARIRALHSQIDAAEEKVRRSKRNADLAADDDSASLFVDDTKRHYRELQRLREELATAESDAADHEPTLDGPFETNAALAVAGLAALANTPRHGPTELRSALRTVLTKETMTVDTRTVTWQLTLLLPHEEGVVELGPIRGTVKNRKRPPRGDTTDQTTQSTHKDDPIRRARIRDLVEAGLNKRAASSIASCPYPELEATLRAHLADRPVPNGIDPSWAGHVINLYTNPDFSWRPGRWRLPAQTRAEALKLVKDAGGNIPLEDLQQHFTTDQIRTLTRQTNTPTGAPILTITGRRGHRIVHLIDCPHCGGAASLSCLTPETAIGILCPTCMKLPTKNSATFPEWYRF